MISREKPGTPAIAVLPIILPKNVSIGRRMLSELKIKNLITYIGVI